MHICKHISIQLYKSNYEYHVVVSMWGLLLRSRARQAQKCQTGQFAMYLLPSTGLGWRQKLHSNLSLLQKKAPNTKLKCPPPHARSKGQFYDSLTYSLHNFNSQRIKLGVSDPISTGIDLPSKSWQMHNMSL